MDAADKARVKAARSFKRPKMQAHVCYAMEAAYFAALLEG